MFELVKRPIGLDDIADVRYLHSTTFQRNGASFHTEEEIGAYIERINSIEYIQECMNCALHGLWHHNMLIGTAGWCPSNDNRNTARIRKVYVHNFYKGLGLGGKIMEDAEERAKSAGFSQFSVRASAGSELFFKSLGYCVTSHGALGLPKGADLPVIYMRKNSLEVNKPCEPFVWPENQDVSARQDVRIRAF